MMILEMRCQIIRKNNPHQSKVLAVLHTEIAPRLMKHSRGKILRNF